MKRAWRAIPVTLGLVVLAWIQASVLARARQEAPRALDATGPIGYFIGTGTAQTGFRADDPELARWALGDWERGTGGVLRFVPVSEAAARVRVYWAGPSSGLFGEMQPLVVGGQLGAAVFIRPDMTSLGPDLAREAARDDLVRDSVVYLTCLHELGHALGLPHSRDFDDIMYFFGYGGDVSQYFNRYRARLHARLDIASTSGLSKADVSRIRALYKGPRIRP